MPNAREIRNRISSIRETRKITNAMYLISSTKMRKAKREWDQTRPYFEALRAEVKRIFRTSGHVESRYLYPDEGELPPDGTYGFLVITADKGLAGAYNQNVLKEAHRLMQEHPQTKLFVVGEYGRQYFQRHQVPIERSFLYTAQNPTMQRAREITAAVVSNSHAAEWLLELCQTGGIRIPEELSVVCFDQPRIFQGMEPLFTYVEQNSFEMGRRAAELLREAFETGQEHACQKLVLEPKLMIHHSTQTFVK